jgi:hypothetical protein
MPNGAGARLLLLGIGNGRNVPPFRAAGIRVDCIEADVERARVARSRSPDGTPRIIVAPYDELPACEVAYDGALSTNALLHGRASQIARTVATVRERLAPDAFFFATFGSVRDPRFGVGTRIDEATFTPASGSEAGIPHAYFDERRLRALLERFTIESIVEASAAETAGTWAHATDEAATIVHWFVRSRRTD